MKVRINNDAHGYAYNVNYNAVGQMRNWVEKFRGVEFEVEEDKNFYRNGIWIVVTTDGKYPNHCGIHTSQATIVDETPVRTTFNEIPVNVPFNFCSKGTVVVCVKIDHDNYMSLENKGRTRQYEVFNIDGFGNRKVYPVIDYKMKFNTYVPIVIKNEMKFTVDEHRVVTIYKNGDIFLEFNEVNNFNIYERSKSEVEKIIKWGKTNTGVGCTLTPDSELQVGCQKFTIKQIRDFTVAYDNFLAGVNNA